MLLDLPQANATLTAVKGGGFSEDYDTAAGADTTKWQGEADAWVHDTMALASDLAGGRNLTTATYVVLPGGLAPKITAGDTLHLERDGVVSTREVREISGPHNARGWPHSSMRVIVAPA